VGVPAWVRVAEPTCLVRRPQVHHVAALLVAGLTALVTAGRSDSPPPKCAVRQQVHRRRHAQSSAHGEYGDRVIGMNVRY